jgi:hypothetical protein
MFKNQVKALIVLVFLLFPLVCSAQFFFPFYPVDREEGGYVGNDYRAIPVVWNFIRHFNYNQYFWAHPRMFTYLNNNYVDNMDFAYYCGHGNRWRIWTYWGSVNLATAGYSSHRGYGNVDLEFIVYHSCLVIPSPLEVYNWWSPWITEPNDTFDGLHQSLGFRTVAYVASAPNISNYYGWRIRWNRSVLWSWFQAIWRRGIQSWYPWWWPWKPRECGSVVLHPSCQNDTYGNFAPDPPQNHRNLRIWYML